MNPRKDDVAARIDKLEENSRKLGWEQCIEEVRKFRIQHPRSFESVKHNELVDKIVAGLEEIDPYELWGWKTHGQRKL
jgi:hypothetical protein